MFYNTIDLDQKIFQQCIRKASKQQEKVIAVFEASKDKFLTAFEVSYALRDTYPITSIRRALTDLKDMGILEKTTKQKVGKYGKPNYCYKLI